jgi:hypothetical protein
MCFYAHKFLCLALGWAFSLGVTKISDRFSTKIEFKRSSVGIVTGNGLEDRGSGVRFPAEARNFSLLHCVHTGSEANPASNPVDTGGSFPWAKVTGA